MAAFLVGEEMRARRFYFANGRIHLRPADRHYTEETYEPEASDCYVIGRVFCVFRLL
jgi:repressor LexA